MQSDHHSFPTHDCNSIAIVPSFTLRAALSAIQFLICVALTYNDSKIIPRKTCQIPENCQWEWLLVSSSAPGTSSGSSGSPGKFSFYKGRKLPNLVTPQRIDEYVETHILHWEPWSAVIRSSFFRSGHGCTSESSARSPRKFRPQTDVAIVVFREMSKDVVCTWNDFC